MGPQEMVMDAKDIDRTISRMTHRILEIHKGAAGLTLIGIQTRGVFLARRIQEKIQVIEGTKVETGDMDITLYRDDWTRISHHPVVQATDILFAVDEREIILVDDVLFTGRTTRAAMDAIMDFGRPARIELAVLVDRGHRELPIQADYVGRFIETRRSETINVFFQEHDETEQVLVARRDS